MLPPEHRLRSTSLFGETVRRGRKKGTRTVVVYLYVQGGTFTGGPRMGLVVSKAVGNAVTRHAVSRRLRHVTGSVLRDATPDPALDPAQEQALPPGACVVLRALPAAATATSKELEADVRRALRRLTD